MNERQENPGSHHETRTLGRKEQEKPALEKSVDFL